MYAASNHTANHPHKSIIICSQQWTAANSQQPIIATTRPRIIWNIILISYQPEPEFQLQTGISVLNLVPRPLAIDNHFLWQLICSSKTQTKAYHALQPIMNYILSYIAANHTLQLIIHCSQSFSWSTSTTEIELLYFNYYSHSIIYFTSLELHHLLYNTCLSSILHKKFPPELINSNYFSSSSSLLYWNYFSCSTLLVITQPRPKICIGSPARSASFELLQSNHFLEVLHFKYFWLNYYTWIFLLLNSIEYLDSLNSLNYFP